MIAWDTVKSWTKEMALTFQGLATEALELPYIGNWCYQGFSMDIYVAQIEFGRWLDDAQSRLAQILSWDSIRDSIKTQWTWLNTIDDKIRAVVSTIWPWLNLGSAAIIGWVAERWTWLNTIDDKIVDTVTARWTWFNTIDDKIKDVSWNHIRPQLADWFWSFIVLEVTLVSKIGYRVLSTLWNMEWDDTNKEAK
jgi:hypothetical protein